MPETAEGVASSGGAERGGGGRGGRSGGGRNRGGGGGSRGGGRAGTGDSSGGNNRRGEGRGDFQGENNGRRSPQQQNQAARNEPRSKKVGDHKVDMRKYERMITANHSNFSDIKITDPITEDCLICCKPNDIFGVGPCRHPLCIECAIRIRVIANSEGCPVCRQPMEKMAFVFASADPTTISLSMPAIHPDEQRYKVCFQNKEASARYEQYLSHVCKLCVVDGERKEFASFVSLRQHMAQTHQLSFCHHCVANLQLFSRERTTYNRSQLQEHIRGGDRDDRSQKGHPKCLFCEERFFDEDDRYRHLRREHFFCQLCETTGAAANVFFGKHDELLKHYEQKHFLCEIDECKKAGIAFATKLDLDIHTSREHGKVNLAVDFSFNDRQVGGPSRNRGGRQYGGGGSHAAPPLAPQGPRGVGLVPAPEQPQPRSDPSQFVVVPSAQASRPSLRYARNGGFSALSDAEAFPSLGPAVASSSAGINYASGPPVVVPSDFPRLKPQPNRPPPPPAVSAANIASGAAKKKEKKKETREEAFPSLGGSSRAQQHQQQETAQWARHTERFDVIDDDEREAFQTVGRHGVGPPPRVGPAVQPSRVAMIQRPATQPRGKQPAPMPSALSAEGEDFPSLPPPGPPTARIDYGRVGGPLAQTSKWGKKKAEEAKKRPPPPPLPEPEMWPAMSSSSSAARREENPDWQEVSIPLSKKALAKRENAEKNARKKEEKRLAREAREAEERAAVRMDLEEEDEEDEEEEEEEEEEVVEVKKAPEPVLGLSEISRLITTAPSTETKKDGKGKGKEQVKAVPAPKREEPAKTSASISNNNSKKKEKRGGDSAPSSIDKPPVPPTTVPPPSQSSSLGLIGSLFNSVYTSFVGGGDATTAAVAAQNGSATKQPTAAAAAVADARARGLSTALPPGISFAPPPGFGPPPGFENVVKRA